MTCHHPLLLQDPDLSFSCWGGNPYCLVLFSRFNKQLVLWTMTALLHRKTKSICQLHCHFLLNTTLPTFQTPWCFPNFISVEGHMDWITVTILMYKLWVSMTSISGHSDLNENQTTPFLSGVTCWGHSDLMWLPKEPLWLRNHSTFGSTQVIFHPLGCAQPMTTLHPPSIPPQGMHSFSAGRIGTGSLSLL